MSYTQSAIIDLLSGSMLFWFMLAVSAIGSFALFIYPTYISAVRNVNGPRPTSWLFGNVVELFTKDASLYELQWSRTFGGIFSLRWAFGETRLYVSDPAALHHILVTECYSYPKPDQLRDLMSGFMGQGLLFAEGDAHKRQRKVVGPAFSAAATKQYKHVFNDKARELTSKWVDQLKKDSSVLIDVSHAVSWCTTDIIGLAGFNHSFDSLARGESRLVASLNTLIGSWDDSMSGVAQRSIATCFPALLKIAAKLPVPRAKAMKKCFAFIEDELRDIFNATAYHRDDQSKDFITSILEANAKTVGAKDRLSEAETTGQAATIAMAGLETTSTTITWAVHQLSQSQHVQQRLREEVREIIDIRGDCDFSDDDFHRMPYLDAFVREILRFYSPVGSTLREAAKDDILPLSTPHLCKDNKTYITHLPIKKGQKLQIGIVAFNKNKEIWGEDADLFRPERWLLDNEDDLVDRDGKKAKGAGSAAEVDGKGSMRSFTTYSSTLSFLGGPRGCVGYRFALREIKTIISVLLDSLQFDPRDDETFVKRRTTFVARPVIQGEEALGNQLPLRISLAPPRE